MVSLLPTLLGNDCIIMEKIKYYVPQGEIEQNACEQIEQTALFEQISDIAVFPDIHYCDEKAIPVGIAFVTKQHIFPLVTGKDMGCGVAYLQVPKSDVLRPFDKEGHYRALNQYQNDFTDERLGGGNHFLSLEEDESSLYIICHTGTRNLGIAMYQRNYRILADNGQQPYIDVEQLLDIAPDWFEQYDEVIQYGKKRRAEFCYKTLQFLINNGYVVGSKNKDYIKHTNPDDFRYRYGDSVHNHIKQENGVYVHRKGSTELGTDTVVLPLSMTRGSLLVKKVYDDPASLNSCAHGAGRKLSRTDTLKYWHSTLKEKDRKWYAATYAEMLSRDGKFANGYIQEFDFAYKGSSDILANQPYLKKVTETKPIVTFKFTEI